MALTQPEYRRAISRRVGRPSFWWDALVGAVMFALPWGGRSWANGQIDMPEFIDFALGGAAFLGMEVIRRLAGRSRGAYELYREAAERAEVTERERDAAKKLLDEVPRPLVTATYSAPRDFRSKTHTPPKDEFVFENLSDVAALNVRAEIEDLPASLEAQMLWDVAAATSVMPVLRRGAPITMTPWVVKHRVSRDGSGYTHIDEPLATELRKAARESPATHSWTLRITYEDDRNRTLETTCEIQVDPDLGGINTLAKEIGRVVSVNATP